MCKDCSCNKPDGKPNLPAGVKSTLSRIPKAYKFSPTYMKKKSSFYNDVRARLITEMISKQEEAMSTKITIEMDNIKEKNPKLTSEELVGILSTMWKNFGVVVAFSCNMILDGIIQYDEEAVNIEEIIKKGILKV